VTDILTPDQTFEFRYPFVRETYRAFDSDEDGSGEIEVPTWKPGVRFENVPPEGDTRTHADALGLCRLTVVATFKPGRYPERVFFTRTWVTPDGKAFGKPKLRMTTVGAFRTACRGYRYWSELDYIDGKRVPYPWELGEEVAANG
jgi:hypothetical protein